MFIDCDTCSVRGAACAGCMMSAVLDSPAAPAPLDPDEHRAVEVFAQSGFEVEVLSAPAVRSPMRLVPTRPRRRIA